MAAPPTPVALDYIANVRLPSQKAHSIQIVKMCQAFSRQPNVRTTLWHPFRFAGRDLPSTMTLSAYYGVPLDFPRRRVFSADILSLGPGSKIGYYVQSFTFYLALLAPLLRARTRDTIWYTRDIPLAWLLQPIAERTQTPLFLELHNPAPRWLRVSSRRLARLSGIITISRTLAALCEQSLDIPRDRLALAADGCDLSSPKSLAPPAGSDGLPASNVVGYVGSLGPPKGAHTLLDAMGHLPEATLLVVGGTRTEHSGMANALPAERRKRVVLIPHRPPSEITAWLRRCDVLVLPNSLRYTESSRYTSPMKLFEYLAAGRPIVASRVPAVEEILSDGVHALLVRPDNPRDLAEGIRRVISSPTLGRRLSRNAIRLSRGYTWEKRARRVARFLRDRSLRAIRT